MLKTNLSFFKENWTYLRPETAQGTFINFINIIKNFKINIPFGIVQIGKAFRNEIIARQFLFRMKEFEQMEMQFFINPKNEKIWFEYWKKERINWYNILGIKKDKIRFYKHINLSHYANFAVDIEYKFPFGYKEIEGIHSRTNFDIKNHELFSKKKINYFDSKNKKKYIPYVIETSAGCDRIFLMIIYNSIVKKKRTYFKLPPIFSPFKVAILPLLKKKILIEKSVKIFNFLKYNFKLIYKSSQSIGKRYVYQDLIGTPYCITIDYETLKNNTVTIRNRDTTLQYRLYVNEIYNFLKNKTQVKYFFKS